MEKNNEINHLAYKIASVVLAIVAWLAVANVSDYQTTREISGIPVTQINGEVLDELDQVYDVASGDTVDIVVKGRRSVVGSLGKEDFEAVADLSSMSITNTVPITVSAKDSSVQEAISITYVDNTMKLNLEEKVSIQYPVKVVTTGSTQEGYAVGSTTVSPNIVTVEGPKSAVEKITEVRVSVNVDDKKSDFDSESQIQIFDAYGEQIQNDKIEVDVQKATIHVAVYPTKIVPVNVQVRGNPGDGYGVESVAYQPQDVEIVGPIDTLQRIESIDINDISVSGMTENFQNDIDLRNYLPDGVSVVNLPAEFIVNISITKLTDKSITVSKDDVILTNQKEGYNYDVVLNNYKIMVSGFEDVIEDINSENLKITVDCSELVAGEYGSVQVNFNRIDDVKYSASGTVGLNVTENEE